MVTGPHRRHPIGLDDGTDTLKALDGLIFRTPRLEDADANATIRVRLLTKCENMQRTGAFKVRGAYTCIPQLSPEERARGAITYSSGKHALGVAVSAVMPDTSALIVMPADARAAKMALEDLWPQASAWRTQWVRERFAIRS